MQKAIVLFLIVSFLALMFWLNNFLQQKIQPRQSGKRLLLYFMVMLFSISMITFLMVLVIGKLYPSEIIK
jgi:hypothetical protein